MSKIRSIPSNPWGVFFIFLLFLGVHCLQTAVPMKAYGIESDSPIFQKDPSGAKDPSPLALPEEKPNPSPGWFSILSRIFVSLFLIAVAIILTVWGLRWVWERKGWNSLSDDGKPIKVLASSYLAPRRIVYLVEVGKRILVVGSGGDGLSRLDVITDPEEVAALRQASHQGFPSVFGKALHKQEAAAQEQETERFFEDSRKAMGGYVEKLREISKKKGSGSKKSGNE